MSIEENNNDLELYLIIKIPEKQINIKDIENIKINNDKISLIDDYTNKENLEKNKKLYQNFKINSQI